MDISELQGDIYKFLDNVTIGNNNIRLAELINKQDLTELSIKLAYNLPSYPDVIIKNTKEDVLNVFSDGILFNAVNTEIINLLRIYLSGNINKEQQSLLIFYLMLTLKQKYKVNITNELKEVENYILSYLIKNQNDLFYEIERNSVIGTTENFKNNFIRRTLDFKLIPTKKTLKKFNNYLINK